MAGFVAGRTWKRVGGLAAWDEAAECWRQLHGDRHDDGSALETITEPADWSIRPRRNGGDRGERGEQRRAAKRDAHACTRYRQQ
jgi:hypothetical protein